VKHLKVEYNSVVLFDGPVDEMTWSDGASGVSFAGKFPGQGGSSAQKGANFLTDLLTSVSKAKTEKAVEGYRSAEVQPQQESEVQC